MRPAKVMATLTPERCTPEMIRLLTGAGMAGVRINSAHAFGSTLRRMVDTIRSVAPSTIILVDTKGAEIRTTPFDSPDTELSLVQGDDIEICEASDCSTPRSINIAVEGIAGSLRQASVILFDDGAIQLHPLRPTPYGVQARVVRGGNLGSRKTVALPGATLPALPAVTGADERCISLACECGVDIIAHSFVRSASDVLAVRDHLRGTHIRLYAKIETLSALQSLPEIARVADGLLVARGDLGTYIPLPSIPAAQYRIAREAHSRGISLMVSTQMLHSMERSPAPTRAEVSDISLAVMEGAAWVLLCGETARGLYPVQCVSIAAQTIAETLNSVPYVFG